MFYKEINEDILKDGHISWKDFNKLKDSNKEEPVLDLFDIENFYNFFKNLYKTKTVPKELVQQNDESEIIIDTEILNKDIDQDEMKKGIKCLQNGKAAGIDLILNEFLKTSTDEVVKLIQKLFNECLKFGVYPWNTTIVTPLHKKGCPHDPDNYRAIAVGSNLGKLFSNILLSRLLEFRAVHCPESLNQRGFCKGAQTSDHIFTLNTCIEKYVKVQRKRLYSCFVDFQKAFDTVSREALLYKLNKLGMQGRFFDCLQYMYRNSKARLKMIKKLSACFDVNAGTEQGHPLSPELFKCYIHELSLKINALPGVESPQLNDQQITHLLWADDLVLLALNKESLQLMIDQLRSFCTDWGLIVNIKKTAVIIFNPSGRQLLDSKTFTYGRNIVIPSVKSYCYLGTHFTISGSMKLNQEQLRIKGLRAYFSLKKTVDLSSISKEAVFKLFDALILPVVSYGSQVWLPYTNILSNICQKKTQSDKDTLTQLANDSIERLHLSLLKWTAGVNKRTSNIPIWGDTGRYPLGIQLSKLFLDFHNRLVLLDRNNSPQIVRHAFVEQRNLELTWIRTARALTNAFDPEAIKRTVVSKNVPMPNSQLVRSRLRDWFQQKWEKARFENKKLAFYNEIKNSFGLEPYISLPNHKKTRCTTWLRTSSHKLNIETGRYGWKNSSIFYRACHFCCTSDRITIDLLNELPFSDIIKEDEVHLLKECPVYNEIRQRNSKDLHNMLANSQFSKLFNENYIVETTNFVYNLFRERFPKSKL